MSRDELIALVGVQAKQIAVLTAMNDELAGKLARVEHLLSRNSGNSSMPPSKDDDPGRMPPAATPTRQAGGPKPSRGKQPGALGANLAWVGKPDDQIDRFPQGRCECGHDLAEATEGGIVDRYQQHEIPQMSVTVTQYDQHQVRCGCGKLHTATRPEGARTGLVGYGPNLQAFAVYLMVVHFVPAKRCAELLESLTGAAPSVGFVHGMLARAATLLAEADNRIRALITQAYAVCADETVRHEARCGRAGVRGLRRLAVAAAGLKLRAV
jgi:transposase